MSLPRTGKLDQIIFKGHSQPKAVCCSKVCIQNLGCRGSHPPEPSVPALAMPACHLWAGDSPWNPLPAGTFLLLQLVLHPWSCELQEGAAIAGGKESLG